MAEADSELWLRVSPYLDRALELDSPELEPWLAALDSAHPQLAAELRELLALHAANRASGFMERSPLGPDESLVGQRIGPYTIERALPPGHYGLTAPVLERALIALGQGDTERALLLVNQAIDAARGAITQGKAGAQYMPQLLLRRASIETAAGQGAAAERDATEALGALRDRVRPGEFSSSYGGACLTLARALSAERKDAAARSAAQEAARQLEISLGKDHPDTRAAEALSQGLRAPPG